MSENPQQGNDYVKLEGEGQGKLTVDSSKLLDDLMKSGSKDAVALYNKLSDSVSSIETKFDDLFDTGFSDFKGDTKITKNQQVELMNIMAKNFNQAINSYIKSEGKADDELIDQISQLSDGNNLVSVFKEQLHNIKDNGSFIEQAVALSREGSKITNAVENRDAAIKEAGGGI
ncbi:MAG: hypothetical protein V3575_03950 [Candidatus Absconditabacteria bacterium]